MTRAVMLALVEAVCALPEGGTAETIVASDDGRGARRVCGAKLVGLLRAWDGTPWAWRASLWCDRADDGGGRHATRADAEAWLRAEVARLWPEEP